MPLGLSFFTCNMNIILIPLSSSQGFAVMIKFHISTEMLLQIIKLQNDMRDFYVLCLYMLIQYNFSSHKFTGATLECLSGHCVNFLFLCHHLTPKLRGLKQHTLMITRFLWVRSPGEAQFSPLLQGLSRSCNQGAGRGWGLI